MTCTEAVKDSNSSAQITSEQSAGSKSDTTFKHENLSRHGLPKGGGHPRENVPPVFVLSENVGKKLIKEGDGRLGKLVTQYYGEPSPKSQIIGFLPGKNTCDLWMQSFVADFGKGAVVMTGTDDVYLGTVHHRKFHTPTLLALQIRFNETKTKIDNITVPSKEDKPADHDMARCMAMHLIENLLGKADNEQQIDALQFLVDKERIRSLPEDVRTQLYCRLRETRPDNSGNCPDELQALRAEAELMLWQVATGNEEVATAIRECMKDKNNQILYLNRSKCNSNFPTTNKVLYDFPEEPFTWMAHVTMVELVGIEEFGDQFTRIPKCLERLTNLENLVMNSNPYQLIENILGYNFDTFPRLKSIDLRKIFMLDTDANRLQAVAKRWGFEIEISVSQKEIPFELASIVNPLKVIDAGKRGQLQFMFEKEMDNARQTGKPLCVIGLGLDGVERFDQSCETRHIDSNFEGFIQQALLTERASLRPVFGTLNLGFSSNRMKFLVILPGMSHAQATDLMKELQTGFQCHPYKKTDGNLVTLPFFAGIAQYQPGANPTLDAMHNGRDLYQKMLEHAKRNMKLAEHSKDDKIVASEWAEIIEEKQ